MKTLPQPVLLMIVLLALPRFAIAQAYTVTDLGNFSPSAINNAGQVVGDDTLWDRSKITTIPRLVTNCHAKAINNGGEIIGTSASNMIQAMEEVNDHAFSWKNGLLRDLGRPAKATDYFYPAGINDEGQIVGASYPSPYLWENGHFTRLKVLPKRWPDGPINSGASGINNHGQIVGYAYLLNGESYGVLWQGGNLIRLARLHNGRQGGAIAINDQGQIVGTSGVANSKAIHAVIWQNGKCVDLGLLLGQTDSVALAINNAGEVVGTSTRVAQRRYVSQAFFWSGGRMLDLTALLPPRSGWLLESATGINDQGQIVGTGLFHGRQAGFLLTPKL